ncbi:DUF484 family protein [Sphingomonas sp. ASV193]|uniref:DUF484 family protein n=1 Tax=Sphingomonas sp. ASV193 TaxID=3144405 RepID=UPI0032E872AA
MGGVIDFQDRAVASLRARLGAAESVNEDLLAFARGHSGAVASIHAAVLEAMRADSIDSLLTVVTRSWPRLLGVDQVALALVVGHQGFRADRQGIGFVAPQLVDKASAFLGEVEARSVGRGHALFGQEARRIRAEAVVRVDCGPGLPRGLLLLGQHEDHAIDARHAASLLLFLGRSLGAIVTRWLTATDD